MTRFVPRAALAALSLTAALTLSACGSNPISNAINGAVEDAVEAGVEQAVEAGTGNDIDINTGGNASLPADFPSDIPTPSSGDIYSSIKVDQGWSVNYGWDNADAGMAAVADLIATLQAEGWTEGNVSDLGEFKSWLYENDSYGIVIAQVLDTSNDTVSMSYTITSKVTALARRRRPQAPPRSPTLRSHHVPTLPLERHCAHAPCRSPRHRRTHPRRARRGPIGAGHRSERPG